MATLVSQIALNSSIGLWLFVGAGNPNAGFPSPGFAQGSLYVQQDGNAGQQLFIYDGQTWQFVAPQSPPPINLTASTALTNAQSGSVILCNATAGAFTVTLPPLTGDGSFDCKIVKTDSSSNAITVAPTSGDPFFATATLSTQGLGSEYYATATGWVTV